MIIPPCQYDIRTRCNTPPVIGFDMCIEHLKTPRGLAHARERIDSGMMFTYADLAAEIQKQTEAPLQDYHTTALEQMAIALQEQETWCRQAREMLYQVPREEWRYTDRHGQEQVRSEVKIYEQAMAQYARLVERASKMSLQEKVVSLGRAQTELVIRLAMGTIEDLGLSAEAFDKARAILLERFRAEAHLSARHEAQVEHALENLDAPKVLIR
jgi:hypothetical protein